MPKTIPERIQSCEFCDSVFKNVDNNSFHVVLLQFVLTVFCYVCCVCIFIS